MVTASIAKLSEGDLSNSEPFEFKSYNTVQFQKRSWQLQHRKKTRRLLSRETVESFTDSDGQPMSVEDFTWSMAEKERRAWHADSYRDYYVQTLLFGVQDVLKAYRKPALARNNFTAKSRHQRALDWYTFHHDDLHMHSVDASDTMPLCTGLSAT